MTGAVDVVPRFLLTAPTVSFGRSRSTGMVSTAAITASPAASAAVTPGSSAAFLAAARCALRTAARAASRAAVSLPLRSFEPSAIRTALSPL